MNVILISWENHRRNKGISKALDWELYEIVCNGKPIIYRYLVSSIKTILIILKEKPKIVIAQNPSKILVCIVILFKNIFTYKAVIDAHNRGIYPKEGKSRILMLLSKYFQKYADLTIVTNDALKSTVKYHGGKAFILPDNIPIVPEVNSQKLEGRINIVFICTFDVDEPYLEVLDAALSIPENIIIYFTGKYYGKVSVDNIPYNIRLLGYVPDDKYWATLSSADIIMDLTTRENCLVCGAYEGIAVGKPLILSDTKALRTYFDKGCIYVQPTTKSIKEGIITAVNRINELSPEIDQLKSSLTIDWNNRLINLKQHFNSMVAEKVNLL